LHAQLDAKNAIEYSDASKKQQDRHVRNADTTTNGDRSAKHFDKSNPGAAHAVGHPTSPSITSNRLPKAA
jgi:hypothetical protein